MAALRVQLPDHPRPHRDVTHPDCAKQDSRLVNDYVRTPCHAVTPGTTSPNCHGVTIDTAKRVQYHVHPCDTTAATTTAAMSSTSVPEPEMRTAAHDEDRKYPDPPLPVKLHNNNNGGTRFHTPRTTRRKCESGNGSASVCPKCGRCRCEKCRARRDLPRSWCCGTWECSADSTLDCLTCMCCVRGTFYHCCSDAEEDSNYSENPCGCCDYPKCLARWVFIVAVALFLPCLVLYWPFRGLLTLVADCYNDCGPAGCRCDQAGPATRPLIEAENCSA